MSEPASPPASPMERANAEGYGAGVRVMHWLVAAVIVTAAAIGLGAATASGPTREALIWWHKSFGAAAAALIAVRIAVRARGGTPAWPAGMKQLTRTAALAGHSLLYAFMVAVPATGVLLSASAGYGVPFFGLFRLSPLADKDSWAAQHLGALHPIAAYLFLALIAGHVAMALKHQFLDGNNIFARIGLGRRSARCGAGEIGKAL